MICQYINNYIDNFKLYKNGDWCYEDGILMIACWQLFLSTKESKYRDFVLNYYDKMISKDGVVLNYSSKEYNIDHICPGVVLFDLYDYSKDSKYLKAIDYLALQLYSHPRTLEKNFWHKLRYPNQVWLDGIYMGLVFYARFGVLKNDQSITEDIKNQIANVRKYMYDDSRKLYVHAYDESKKMQWADSKTGKSPNVWSRSVGWLSMAFVDMASYNSSLFDYIKPLFSELIEGLSQHLQSGMLYQIVDKEYDPLNYQETSGSAMVGYAILKAQKINLIDNRYEKVAEKIYETIINNYYFEDDNGKHIGNICKVAGLDNLNRDGSDEYYYSEEVAKDEVKGIAPFIMLYNLLYN